jgi:hypothetical protein
LERDEVESFKPKVNQPLSGKFSVKSAISRGKSLHKDYQKFRDKISEKQKQSAVDETSECTFTPATNSKRKPPSLSRTFGMEGSYKGLSKGTNI